MDNLSKKQQELVELEELVIKKRLEIDKQRQLIPKGDIPLVRVFGLTITAMIFFLFIYFLFFYDAVQALH